MTEDLEARVQAIADELEGTISGSVDVPEWLEEHAQASKMLDDLVQVCEECGWWVSSDELEDDAGDMICCDCFEERRAF